MEREKALDMALGQIQKQFGDGAVMKMGEKTTMAIESIPTGALALDLALGIGGLLTDACRLAQLAVLDDLPESERLARLLNDAVESLGNWAHTDPLSEPLPNRLAFRELGLSIGLDAVRKTRDLIARHPENFPNHEVLETKLADLAQCLPWREEIEEFWLRASSQESAGWLAHREINSVMLATALAPDAFLMLENEALPAGGTK